MIDWSTMDRQEKHFPFLKTTSLQSIVERREAGDKNLPLVS